MEQNSSLRCDRFPYQIQQGRPVAVGGLYFAVSPGLCRRGGRGADGKDRQVRQRIEGMDRIGTREQ